MKKFAWSLLVLVGSGIWAEVVEIPDPNLRTAMEQALYVEVGEDITKEVLARLTVLDANGRQIKNLSGIESCINLTELKLSFNQLTYLTSFNGANLPNLTQLDLYGNQLIDINGLAWANLPHLKTLKLDQNQITDLSGLAEASLPNLRHVYLTSNPLTKDIFLTQIPSLEKKRILVYADYPEDWDTTFKNVWAEVVEVPDFNFRTAVEQALGIEVGANITKEFWLS